MAEAVDNGSVPGEQRARPLHAFRPLAYWLLGSVLLLTWDAYRRTTIQFGISMDLGTLQNLAVTVDGESFWTGKRLKPGFRKIVVSATDADPLEAHRFLWLGINNLGELKLHRSKGTLEVNVIPPPKKVEIKGEFFTGSSTNAPAKFPSLPVGNYQVKAFFEYSTEEQQVRVTQQQTARSDIKAAVGSLALSTVPSDAEFNLTGWSGRELKLKGKTPAVLNQLPVGQYVLQVSREDYRKEGRVNVKPGETNELKVTFEYAEVSVTTDPDGATIFLNDKESGQTPKTITELRPGQYQVRLEKEGFVPFATSLQVKGNESITIATNLTSQAFLAAMADARKLGTAVPVDYERALQALKEALRIKPGDSEATTFKERILSAQSKADENRRTADIAARMRVVLDVFRRATDGEQDAALFDTYTWSFAGRADMLKDALLRSLTREPVSWELKSEQKNGEQSYLVTCTGKHLISRYSHASVFLTQFSPQEVIVHAKFWVYVPKPGEELALLIHSREGVMPLHPKSYNPSQKALVEQQRKSVAEDFRARLQKELN
jgi:PEGA domain